MNESIGEDKNSVDTAFYDQASGLMFLFLSNTICNTDAELFAIVRT